MMNVLVLGGTGAMGVPLVSKLSAVSEVLITTRRPPTHKINNRIAYIQGNAKDIDFLKETLTIRHWDAIVDFMVWDTEFDDVLPLLLSNTDQYVFLSSARVYAQSDEPIKETTPRLLDVSEDEEYLSTNEYALAKAREEDLLFHSGYRNFTIIRPTITYSCNRLQLGVLEKENWLYRVLKGRSIVFSKDIADKITTLTYGDDVASGIASLIGNKEALGEIYHITSPKSLKWSEVLDVYLAVLEKHLGYRPNIVMTDYSTNLKFDSKKYQVIYCRYFNRTFDNTKVGRFCDVNSFTEPQKGLADCLEKFLINPQFGPIDWVLEAVNDKVAGERTKLSEIKTLGEQKIYIRHRYNMKCIAVIVRAFRKILRGTRH